LLGPAGRPHSSSDDGETTDSESWLDTGDIAEQWADDEDPLRARITDTLGEDDELLTGVVPKRQKRVRYTNSTTDGGRGNEAHPGVVNKEAIRIPDTAVRRVSRADRCLAAIMPGAAGLNGLTGKSLMYVVATDRDVIIGAMLTYFQLFHYYFCITRRLFVRIRSGRYVGHYHVRYTKYLL
jgi:hypothetical protein